MARAPAVALRAAAGAGSTHGRGRGLMGGRGARFAAALCIVTFALAAPGYAAETTRPEYVARLEQICKPGSEATQRAVRGVRAEVRDERLRAAAPKVARARRIFAHTVGAIAKVPRPSADRETLARWFTALGRENVALGRTAAALRAEDIARFE